MTSRLRIVKFGLLGAVLVFLNAGPFLLKTAEGKNRPGNHAEKGRDILSATRTKGSALRKKDMPVMETRLDKRSRQSDVNARLENRSTKASRIAKLRLEQKRLEAKRRADAERLAYVRAVQRTRDEELRNKVQALIAKDDLSGEDPEVRRVAVAALGIMQVLWW